MKRITKVDTDDILVSSKSRQTLKAK